MLKILSTLFILSTLLFSSSKHHGCWTVQEESLIAFDELEEEVTFLFRDDTTCKKISGAKVTFAGKTRVTNSNGSVSFPISLIEDIFNGKKSLIVKKHNYITYNIDLDVMVGTVWKNKFLISKYIAPKEVKFVLEWTKYPRDLDLHLKTKGYHISYRNKNSSKGEANLDVDDVSSFGPETILLKKIDYSKKYVLFIDIYSFGSKKLTGKNQATVSVYKDSKLDRVVLIKNQNTKKVDVLSINKGVILYK